MDTTATVFGISAENARFIGKWISWIWLWVGYYFADSYTYMILIANMLHFNHDVLDWIGV